MQQLLSTSGSHFRMVGSQVWVNGAPLTERFKQRSAYVAQEELFMPTLNAWETLEFQAVLRNRAGLSHAKLRERMHDVMAVMGLSRQKNTQVCKLLFCDLLFIWNGSPGRRWFKGCSAQQARPATSPAA